MRDHYKHFKWAQTLRTSYIHIYFIGKNEEAEEKKEVRSRRSKIGNGNGGCSLCLQCVCAPRCCQTPDMIHHLKWYHWHLTLWQRNRDCTFSPAHYHASCLSPLNPTIKLRKETSVLKVHCVYLNVIWTEGGLIVGQQWVTVVCLSPWRHLRSHNSQQLCLCLHLAGHD